MTDNGNEDNCAELLGVSVAELEQARRNIEEGVCAFLVVSGKLASGKDTVAPAVLEANHYLADAAHQYYALPLKAEMDTILAFFRVQFNTDQHPVLREELRHQAALALSQRMSFNFEDGLLYAGALLDAVREDDGLNARTRTPLMRAMLQHHGTQVRRAQDDLYWVVRALRPTVPLLAAGRSVYFTDVRFPNEVEMAQRIGAFALRLDVTRETQLARLKARDGITNPSEESLTHASEVALDDYQKFDLRIDNNGTLAEAIAAVTAHGLSAARPLVA